MLKQKRITLSLLTLAMFFVPLYSQAKTYVYVSAPNIDNVYQYSLDENTGSLEMQNKYYFGGNIQYSIVSPDNKYFYAVFENKKPGFVSLEINKDNGILANKKDSNLEFPYKFIAINKTGNLLLGIHEQNSESAEYTEDFIRIQKIKEGKLSDIIATYSKLHSYDYSMFDNKGENIYSNDILSKLKYSKKDEDIAYISSNTEEQSSDLLSLSIVSIENTNDNAIYAKKYVFSNNNFLYTYDPYDASIKQYSLSNNDLPKLLFQTKSIGAQVKIYQQDISSNINDKLEVHTNNCVELKYNFNISDIKITPNNKFLYLSDNKNNQIIGYRLDEKTGNPEIIGTWETEEGSSSISIDPSSKWLISAGISSNYISVFSIDTKNGSLYLSGRKKYMMTPKKTPKKQSLLLIFKRSYYEN